MDIQEIRNWYHARPGYWFRPKLFGYGAVPVTWQGWALTFAMIAGTYQIAIFAMGHGLVWLALPAPLVAGFVLICRAKTDGDWRWRWGQPD